jgi:hypothetical protein
VIGALTPKKLELVKAKKPRDDDAQVMLVYAASGELVDIELV